MVKQKETNGWKIFFGIILVFIAILLILILSYNLINNNEKMAGSTINVEIDNPNANIASLVNDNCFWLGNEIRCSGSIRNIASEDTGDDIFIVLVAKDKETDCDSSCSGSTNLGILKKGETKTYSVSCEVNKKKDVVAEIIVSGTNGITLICS